MGVAVDISGQLTFLVVGVTPVGEQMMLVRLKLTLDFISLTGVYDPTEMCELEVKKHVL